MCPASVPFNGVEKSDHDFGAIAIDPFDRHFRLLQLCLGDNLPISLVKCVQEYIELLSDSLDITVTDQKERKGEIGNTLVSKNSIVHQEKKDSTCNGVLDRVMMEGTG